jgi:hypothetical protein
MLSARLVKHYDFEDIENHFEGLGFSHQYIRSKFDTLLYFGLRNNSHQRINIADESIYMDDEIKAIVIELRKITGYVEGVDERIIIVQVSW